MCVLNVSYSGRVPNPQTVYRDGDRILMYVRTEHRGGRKAPEHLFVTTRNRVVFQLWTEEVPPEAELILDTEGREEAERVKWLLHVAEHEHAIAMGLLKRACEWLPRERAQELRKAFAETRP